MAIHILFDQRTLINRNDRPCGFCLSMISFCSIVLVKSKGGDGTICIDMAKSRYKSHYELVKGEEVVLRTISTTKKEFSQLSDDKGDEPDDESDSSSHSPSPDIEDERQSPTPLRPLSPMEEEDNLPSPSDLLTHSRPPAQSIAPRVQADSATDAVARVLTDDPQPNSHRRLLAKLLNQNTQNLAGLR
ncbi:hypothetical protein B0H10DRAFT_1964435 [Mycena sp. CBHHK59/15]|nr:hypothetical protein B0H10DRAFT_1964435 [Mycena sp. CBHHK59/15]